MPLTFFVQFDAIATPPTGSNLIQKVTSWQSSAESLHFSISHNFTKWQNVGPSLGPVERMAGTAPETGGRLKARIILPFLIVSHRLYLRMYNFVYFEYMFDGWESLLPGTWPLGSASTFSKRNPAPETRLDGVALCTWKQYPQSNHLRSPWVVHGSCKIQHLNQSQD